MHDGWLQRISRVLQMLAVHTTSWVGSSWAFLVALMLTMTWLASGPLFGFADTWQLVMNTVSSIVTFLMVFLLQRSQNKEFMALQLKLSELIAAKHGASNRLISVEDLSEEEVNALHDQFKRLHDRLLASKAHTDAASIDRLHGDAEPAGKALPPAR
jgi:low affinity Fe/Cu permease